MAISNLYFKLGLFYAKNIYIPFIFLFLIIGIIVVGMLKLEITNDKIDLWVDRDSIYFKQQIDKFNLFGEDFRINQLIHNYRDKTKLEENIINKENIEETYLFKEIIANFNFIKNLKRYNIENICWKPFDESSCTIQTPINFWFNNLEYLRTDDDIKETIKCTKKFKGQTVACADDSKVPTYIQSVFNGIKYLEDTCNIKRGCNTSSYTAVSMSTIFLFKNDLETSSLGLYFEKNILKPLIEEYNKSLDYSFFIKHLYKTEKDKSDDKYGIMEKMENKLKLFSTYMLEISIEEEIEEETNLNKSIVILSFVIMFVYISISLGRFPSLIGSNILISIFGIILIIISCVFGFSISTFLGYKGSLISVEIIPFLILAIGVDNMFLIYRSIYSINSKILVLKFALGLENASYSITLATFTQIFSFLIGSFIPVPALKSFCITAAFAIICNYFLQIHIFSTLIYIDLIRKKGNRIDLMPLIKLKNNKTKFHLDNFKDDLISRFFKKCITPLIFNLYFKIFVLSICIIMFILSIVSFIKLDLGLDNQVAMIKDGNLYNYFGYIRRYIEAGPPGYIILKNIDYSKLVQTKIINDFQKILLSKDGLINIPIRFWLNDYMNMSTICPDFGGGLEEFLNMSMDDVCCKQKGICGKIYKNDVVFNHNSKEKNLSNIKSSVINFLNPKLNEQLDFINNFYDMNTVTKIFEDKLKQIDTNIEVYNYSLFYIFFEQYLYIKRYFLENSLLIIIVLLTLIFIFYSIEITLFLLIAVVGVVTNIYGLIYINNLFNQEFKIELNAILLINIILSIGFAFEFSVHILIAFENFGGTKRERIERASNEVSSIIFQGIFLTKILGILVLVFIKIPLFTIYYFKVYLFIILVASFYGILVLPILLDLLLKSDYKKRFSINKVIQIKDLDTSIDIKLIKSKLKEKNI